LGPSNAIPHYGGRRRVESDGPKIFSDFRLLFWFRFNPASSECNAGSPITMTVPARITQADMTRAAKAVAAAGLDACIELDLANQKIRIIVGGPMDAENNDWTDDV